MLIWGALAATMLGALAALQLDLFLAAGERLMDPGARTALIRTTETASLTGLLCWVACAVVTRGISGAALKPYNAITDHFERLADGEVGGALELRGPAPGARRLARVVDLFHQRALESQRSEAALQARFDRLHQDHAEERRLLTGLLMSQPVAGYRVPPDGVPARPENPEPPAAAPQGAGGMKPQTVRHDSVFEDARERRLLMEMLMIRRPDPEGPAARLRPPVGVVLAEFDIPEQPPAAPEKASGPPPRDAPVVDPTGRLEFPARRVDQRPGPEPVAEDRMPLNFTFIRR